jgi:hypothetical protein
MSIAASESHYVKTATFLRIIIDFQCFEMRVKNLAHTRFEAGSHLNVYVNKDGHADTKSAFSYSSFFTTALNGKNTSNNLNKKTRWLKQVFFKVGDSVVGYWILKLPTIG